MHGTGEISHQNIALHVRSDTNNGWNVRLAVRDKQMEFVCHGYHGRKDARVCDRPADNMKG